MEKVHKLIYCTKVKVQSPRNESYGCVKLMRTLTLYSVSEIHVPLGHLGHNEPLGCRLVTVTSRNLHVHVPTCV